MLLVTAAEERISVPVRIDSMVLLKAKAMNVPADLSMFLVKTIDMHVPCSFRLYREHVPAEDNQMHVLCSCSCVLRV